MTLCGLLLVLGALALFFYVREKVARRSLKAVFLKSVVSVLFIALAVCARHAAASLSPLGCFVTLGLVLGLLGDVWLDLKYVYPSQDAAFTYAGFASFALGHALYIAGMLAQYYRPDAAAYAVVPLLLGVACGFAVVLLEKPMGLRYGRMRPIAAVYGALLFSTTLLALGLAFLYGWRETTLNLLFAGGVLFAASDLILSGTYFGEGRDKSVDLILNYLTYYPAQFLIAFSLAFLR